MKYKELTDISSFDRKNEQEFKISINLVKELYNSITDETTFFILTTMESDDE